MPIITRRWNDAPKDASGLHILITRYRPRGVRKADETWDVWMPELGPSKELHAAVYGKVGLGIDWATYRARYLIEMRQQTEAIKSLAERVAKGETITLLCSSQCDREARCHRSLLRELIERQATQP